MTNPQDKLTEMHRTIDRLYAAYQEGTSSPELTGTVVGYLKQLQAERASDGAVVLKTPLSTDQGEVSAWAEIANRGLAYLGLTVDMKQIRRAHSDVMMDIFQQATRHDLASMVEHKSSSHDHVQFTITPQDMQAFAKALPDDHRRPVAESLLKAMQPASAQPAAAPTVGRHHSF